jgi:hypothetical protein
VIHVCIYRYLIICIVLEAIKGVGRPSRVWGGHHGCGEAIKGVGRPSRVWGGHQGCGEAITGVGRPSRVWGGHHGCGEAITGVGRPSRVWGGGSGLIRLENQDIFCAYMIMTTRYVINVKKAFTKI